jgi:hypothetical protein
MQQSELSITEGRCPFDGLSASPSVFTSDDLNAQLHIGQLTVYRSFCLDYVFKYSHAWLRTSCKLKSKQDLTVYTAGHCALNGCAAREQIKLCKVASYLGHDCDGSCQSRVTARTFFLDQRVHECTCEASGRLPAWLQALENTLGGKLTAFIPGVWRSLAADLKIVRHCLV